MLLYPPPAIPLPFFPPPPLVPPPLATAMADMIPDDLAAMRSKLFNSDKCELTPPEFERYWPFMENVWEGQEPNKRTKENTQRTQYRCRCRRDAIRKRVETGELNADRFRVEC